jgi:hypothetical protein
MLLPRTTAIHRRPKPMGVRTSRPSSDRGNSPSADAAKPAIHRVKLQDPAPGVAEQAEVERCLGARRPLGRSYAGAVLTGSTDSAMVFA